MPALFLYLVGSSGRTRASARSYYEGMRDFVINGLRVTAGGAGEELSGDIAVVCDFSRPIDLVAEARGEKNMLGEICALSEKSDLTLVFGTEVLVFGERRLSGDNRSSRCACGRRGRLFGFVAVRRRKNGKNLSRRIGKVRRASRRGRPRGVYYEKNRFRLRLCRRSRTGAVLRQFRPRKVPVGKTVAPGALRVAVRNFLCRRTTLPQHVKLAADRFRRRSPSRKGRAFSYRHAG